MTLPTGRQVEKQMMKGATPVKMIEKQMLRQKNKTQQK